MAQAGTRDVSEARELEIVEFYIDEADAAGNVYRGHYGINVAKVLEIIRRPSVTEMPSAPHPSILGAFNQRNRVIPLVDLALWLGKNPPATEAEKVIVTEFNRVINAFLVSGVNRIHRLSWEQIEPPSQQVQTLSGNTLTGVVKQEGRVIFLLDFEKIIGDLNPDLFFKEEQATEAAVLAMAADDAEPPGAFKALVVDDSTSIRRMIGSMLEKAGFAVTRTFNGKEAWEILARTRDQASREGRPLHDLLNIVVTDIEMPIMDGHTLTRRIKADPVLKDLPVVLFSSLITDSLRHLGAAAGADEQVSKPDLPGLASLARNLVRKYRR
ncbi:MAG: chemotaxis protein [Thermodesulfobacteriota bacterium]